MTTPTRKVTQRTHPAKAGWLRLTLTLKSAQPLTPDELFDLASFGRPTDYEFAAVVQRGNTVRAVVRRIDHRPRISALDATPVTMKP